MGTYTQYCAFLGFYSIFLVTVNRILMLNHSQLHNCSTAVLSCEDNS